MEKGPKIKTKSCLCYYYKMLVISVVFLGFFCVLFGFIILHLSLPIII